MKLAKRVSTTKKNKSHAYIYGQHLTIFAKRNREGNSTSRGCALMEEVIVSASEILADVTIL